jgi:hypothetical protein
MTPYSFQVLKTVVLFLVSQHMAGAPFGDPRENTPQTTDQTDAVVDALFRELRAQDAVFNGSWSASFEIEVPFALLGPKIGPHTKVCRYTDDRTLQGLYIEIRYVDRPPYQPVGHRGVNTHWVDDAQDLTVWRILRKWSLRSDKSNASFWERQQLVINPLNQVVSDFINHCVDRFAPSDTTGIYEFMEFRLASGRGFSLALRDIKSVRELPDGVREVVAQAEEYGRPGLWRLKVASDSDHGLVREGVLTFDDTPDAPGVLIETWGTWSENGIVLAREGSITYHFGRPYVQKVTIIDFQPRADEPLLDELRARVLAPTPDGVTVYDWAAQRETPKER